jgi:hypothetical protein
VLPPDAGDVAEFLFWSGWRSGEALVFRDNYFCRVATITFAGLGRPDWVW